jgi:energy-coupling factor transport system substrate-specific component
MPEEVNTSDVEASSVRKRSKAEYLALIVVCISINIGIGFIVSAFKLPFYLDSIGTILATFLGGPLIGIATGVLSVVIGSIYTPTLWAYAITAICIAVFTWATIKLGYLRTLLATILGGIGLGIATAIVSAPITTYLFGGVSLAGADAFTAYFAATGKTLLDSVVLGGLATDPVDKLFTSLIVYVLLKRIPKSWKRNDE